MKTFGKHCLQCGKTLIPTEADIDPMYCNQCNKEEQMKSQTHLPGTCWKCLDKLVLGRCLKCRANQTQQEQIDSAWPTDKNGNKFTVRRIDTEHITELQWGVYGKDGLLQVCQCPDQNTATLIAEALNAYLHLPDSTSRDSTVREITSH